MAPGKRIKNLAVYRPLVYGNVASLLREKDETVPVDHTHKWTIFVREPSGRDARHIVKRVIFKLHDTYPTPMRVVETPPFELTETGWGEFEISIRIFFVPEANEKNVLVYHHLKLHPYPSHSLLGAVPSLPPALGEHPMGAIRALPDTHTHTAGPRPLPYDHAGERASETPVESYLYDEVVFNEPTEALFELLTTKHTALVPARSTDTVKYSLQAEADELEHLSSALERVYQQVQKVRDRICKLEREKKALGVSKPAPSQTSSPEDG